MCNTLDRPSIFCDDFCRVRHRGFPLIKSGFSQYFFFWDTIAASGFARIKKNPKKNNSKMIPRESTPNPRIGNGIFPFPISGHDLPVSRLSTSIYTNKYNFFYNTSFRPKTLKKKLSYLLYYLKGCSNLDQFCLFTILMYAKRKTRHRWIKKQTT